MHTYNENIELAREWAEDAGELRERRELSRHTKGAIELINGLPNQIIDAENLREWMNTYIQEPEDTTVADVFTDLQSKFLIPLPEFKFGDWVTHPEHGEVLIVSVPLKTGGSVHVMRESSVTIDGISSAWVPVNNLTPMPKGEDEGFDTSKEYLDSEGDVWEYRDGEWGFWDDGAWNTGFDFPILGPHTRVDKAVRDINAHTMKENTNEG